MNKQEILKKWREMTPKKRMLVAGGGGVAVLIVLTTAFGSNGVYVAPEVLGQGKSNFNLPMDKDVSIEQLAAQLQSMKDRLATEENKRAEDAAAAKAAAEAKPVADPITSDVARELRDMRVELETLKSQRASVSVGGPAPSDDLPPADMPNVPGGAPGQSFHSMPEIKPEHPPLRIIGGSIKKAEVLEDPNEKKVLAYLPLGSNFEGVLMNGMDAPTSSAAKSNPVPALIRLDTDAILPSRYRHDVRECFTIVTGFGVLSTERAQLQTTSISCIKEDGSVIEAKAEGYVVGEDGKTGLRGRLVSKQGSLLAKSFATGFFTSLGQAFSPTAVPQLNVAPGANQQFQMPSASNVVGNGLANGITNSAKSLSQFYLDMAKEMFPVIEIDAMRRVTIILVKGVELSSKGGN